MHSGRRNSFPLLASYFDTAACTDGSKNVCIEMEKMKEPKVEEDITDFTLTYSTNILLCNTKMRLPHGEKCGLLGGNSSGKTTLIWSIANNQVEDFSSSRTIGAVFVMVDIQRKQSHTSCIEDVFIDKHIQDLKICQEVVKEMLAMVGFIPNGSRAKPDTTVSMLCGGLRMKLALVCVMLPLTKILFMDKPMNNFEAINVAWVMIHVNFLMNITSHYSIPDCSTTAAQASCRSRH